MAELPFDNGKPEEIPGRKAYGSQPLSGEGRPGYLTPCHAQGIGGAHMKKLFVLTALLLPTVLLASVTETAIPSTTEAYLAAAGSAMEDGDFDAALLLYEEAVEREPHSQVALAGRLIAFSKSSGSGSTIEVAGLN